MIAFLIGSLDVRGGTHKQLLKLLDYTYNKRIPFIVVTNIYDEKKTYPGFLKYKDLIKIIGIPYTCSHKTFFSKIRAYISFSARLKQLIKDADIINIHDNGFEKYFPVLGSKKIYWQINDLPYYFTVGNCKNSEVRHAWIKKILLRILLHNVTDITVNVGKNKERVRKYLHRDAKVFYCGIDPIKINRNMSETLERLQNRKINLLTSGVFFEYRNYETQIQVVKKLLFMGYDVRLNIIGSTSLDTQYALKIRNMIKEDELENHITICGQVDEERFESLHNNSDIFLFVNIDQSWGLAVFEAMSCGIPVIVSNSVGATDILSDKINSIFVNPIDVDDIVNQILSLASNKDSYIKLSNASKDFCSRYSWDEAYSSKLISLMLDNECF